MKPSLRYNFDEMLKASAELLEGNVTPRILKTLQNELNSFFKDATCKEILFTENNDKLFFGMYVIPDISPYKATEIVTGDEPVRITDYYLEIDSKLTNPILALTPNEFVAFLLHEVGHMVKDANPVGQLRNEIDTYLAANKEILKLSRSIHYEDLMAFGIKDTLQRMCSIFEKDSDELIADEFVYEYGFGDHLQSGFEKITRSALNINGNVTNKFITMMWVLRLYRDLPNKRIPALKALKNAKKLTPSKLEAREIDNAIRRINHIDDNTFSESVFDKVADKYNEKLSKMRYQAMRSLDDDYYEYSMRIRNVEDEEDALYLMRQINLRIAILDDYLSTSKLSDHDFKKWSKSKDNFEKIRDELTKMTVYRVKNYGIYINYPDIKPDRY